MHTLNASYKMPIAEEAMLVVFMVRIPSSTQPCTE
jgi:hypothetical protein